VGGLDFAAHPAHRLPLSLSKADGELGSLLTTALTGLRCVCCWSTPIWALSRHDPVQLAMPGKTTAQTDAAWLYKQ